MRQLPLERGPHGRTHSETVIKRDLGQEVWDELEAIRTAVYRGDPRRHPEEDVRFLLGLVHELTR